MHFHVIKPNDEIAATRCQTWDEVESLKQAHSGETWFVTGWAGEPIEESQPTPEGKG